MKDATIFLVGLPGAGKSTVGKFLAHEMVCSFVDLDLVIEQTAGMPVPEIFAKNGEAYFRLLEKAALRSLPVEKSVVATGGGAPCFHGNMDWMNQHGITLFLNPPIDIILKRVEKQGDRPLLAGNAREKLTLLAEERLPYYRQAGLEFSQTEPCEIWAELREFPGLKS